MTDLFKMADDDGIPIEYGILPLNKSMSASTPYGNCVIMDYSLTGSRRAEKECLAHELGHCKTGSFYNAYTQLDIRQKHENRADKWAINEMIPVELLDIAIAAGHEDVWSLAEHFDVTVEFMQKALCLHIFGNLAVEWYL